MYEQCDTWKKTHLEEEQRYKEHYWGYRDGFTGRIRVSPKSPCVPGQ